MIDISCIYRDLLLSDQMYNLRYLYSGIVLTIKLHKTEVHARKDSSEIIHLYMYVIIYLCQSNEEYRV